MKTVDFDIKYREKIEKGDYKVTFRSKTRELPARIICWDRKGIANDAGDDEPIVALFTIDDGSEILVEATANGHVWTRQDGSHQALYVTYQNLPSKLHRVKFDFTKLKAFTPVLARTGDHQTWFPHFFESYHPDNHGGEFYMLDEQHTLIRYSQCVPYEGNEKLLKTQDPIPPFYDIRKK